MLGLRAMMCSVGIPNGLDKDSARMIVRLLSRGLGLIMAALPVSCCHCLTASVETVRLYACIHVDRAS